MNQAAGTGDRGPRTDDPGPEGPIVLFDGVCNLCAGAVRFIIPRDRCGRFRFAALQSDAGRRILAATGVETPGADEPPESLILVADRRTYARSGAALRIAAGLGGGWPLLAVFLVIPAPLRDLAYRFVARNRYRWFGKQTACELPRTEESWRFLDA
ncbi:MAG: DUF393 domain-containing protein [Gemmatimonadales bacterium]|nr:DUF393 domain-containing protein [Gemmatimonadales bacterium]MYL06782.1 DUF393 domain-containing protein [Gemmatimonadales bacterium]